jgi:GDPmannose 4,6-dehydratase
MRALITGVTGQDGSYLAEFLLEKGYEVYGIVRRTSLEKYDRLESVADRIHFVEGDLTDQGSLDVALQSVQPDEVYNLAAQSYVAVSWNQPSFTADVTGVGVLRVLEAIRRHAPRAKFLQASSSEMFGKVTGQSQNEDTPFHPRSPYAVAKVFGHYITVNYRESYGLFAASCIAFNHESSRRGTEFVTRKVTQQVARIKLGLADKLKMGNLDVKRDWGFAGDYVRAMWMILQQPAAGDFVIATGQPNSVRDLLEIAFSHVGLNWKNHVEMDPAFLRPAEVEYLCGDPSKARRVLGWQPRVAFRELIEMMVQSDLAALKQTAAARAANANSPVASPSR